IFLPCFFLSRAARLPCLPSFPTRRSSDLLQALIAAGTPVCTIFGKTWTLHVTEVLRTTLEQNLVMIEESVAFLRAAGKMVVYDRSEEHTSELQSRENLVCRLLLEKKKKRE